MKDALDAERMNRFHREIAFAQQTNLACEGVAVVDDGLAIIAIPAVQLLQTQEK